jgi:hypothetical protein
MTKIFNWLTIAGSLPIVLFSSNAYSQWDCLSGKLRYLLDRKTIEESARYCVDTSKNHIVSENCVKTKDKPCSALKSGRVPFDFDDFNSPFGSPGFKFCLVNQGQPQIFEYSIDNKWKSSSRCIFKNDNSYSDIDFMIGKAKQGGYEK